MGRWSIELQLAAGGGQYDIVEETYTFYRVPEPSVLALMVVGLLGIVFYRSIHSRSTVAH